MGINLANFEERAQAAVIHFWQSRTQATVKQAAAGKTDQGERSAVTAGRHMDGIIKLVEAIVLENGLTEAEIFTKKRFINLPGFYRPTKEWDLLVVHRGQLVAALECKSQVGSFGNNFNNRCEEALGAATDLWTAFREGVFGDSPRPFIGYFVLLEDCSAVHRPVRLISPHFPALPEFENTSYAQRYELLCRKLVHEGLYDAATLLLSSRETGLRGVYSEPSEMCGLGRLVATLAGRIAAMAAMK